MRELLLNQHNRTKGLRQLSLFFALLLLPMGVWGQTDYGLTVAGVDVTSANAANITGQYLTEGTAVFDANSNTLTLTNVAIGYGGVQSGLENLTIIFNGTNMIESYIGANADVAGTHNLTLQSGTEGSTMYLDNTVGKSIIDGFDNVSMDGLYVSSETPYAYNATAKQFKGVQFSGVILQNATITSTPHYSLWVGYTQLSDENKTDLFPNDQSLAGKVSFDNTSNTLSLQNADLTYYNVFSVLSDLTIDVSGYCSVGAGDSATAVRNVHPSGVLTLKSTGSGNQLTFNNNRPIRDFSSLTLTGLYWDGDYTYGPATIEEWDAEKQESVQLVGKHLLKKDGSEAAGAIAFSDLPRPSMYPSYNQQTNEPTFGFEGDPSWEIRYSIDYVDESLADVTNALYDMQGDNVPLQGAATVTAWTVFGDATSDEVKGKLFELSETSLSTVYGTAETLSAPTLRPAIDPEDKITLSYIGREQSDVATIDASTGEVTILGPGSETFNVDISIDDGCTVLNYEDLTFDVTVQDGYPLTINNTQVTEENRLDVLGDGGTVRFDGKNTLILNNAWISSVILGADDSWVKKGLTIYLKGDVNNIGEQEQDGLIYQGQDANVPLTFATGDVEPGTLTLSYSAQPLVGFTPTYLNNLTDMMNPDLQQITIAVSMEPFVTQSEEEKTVDGRGVGLGQDIENAETSTLTAGILVNKILYILPDDADGCMPEDNKKVVAINSSMTDAEANTIMAAVINGTLLPGTPGFAAIYKGMTFLLPAGNGDIVLDVNTNQSGELHVKVGNNDPVVISGTTGFEERRVPYALTEASYVFIYNVTSAPSSSRRSAGHRAPGRKETTTVGIKGLSVSASDVSPAPAPALSPVSLKKSDISLDVKGRIIVVNPEVTEIDADAFEGKTGITYIDLSQTGIKDFTFDRTSGAFSGVKAFVYLPAGNKLKDVNEPNVVLGSVCQKFEMSDDDRFMAAKDFVAKEVELERLFDTEKTGTVYLPFALDAATAASLGKFYELKGFDEANTTVSMVSVEETKANTPYMFKPAKDKISVEMAEVKADIPGAPVAGKIKFVGTYEIKNICSDVSTQYYCFMADGPMAGKFVHVTETAVKMNPYRAYMEMEGSASSRDFDLMLDGVPTGIQNIKVGTDNNVYYDLSGRRVLYPKKGMYIMNGKKVIIK